MDLHFRAAVVLITFVALSGIALVFAPHSIMLFLLWVIVIQPVASSVGYHLAYSEAPKI